MDHAFQLKEIKRLSKKIAALQRRQSSDREWGYGRAVALQTLIRNRSALQGELPPLRLVT